MKVRIEIEEELSDDEVIIRCKDLSDEIKKLHEYISEQAKGCKGLTLKKNSTDYFIPVESILFFETEGSGVSAHTADDMYETEYKLYELEDLLPGYFVRISKSTIANINHIFSVAKNLTSSSVVEFAGTHKKVYVSRHYYKPLKSRLEEKWTRKCE